MTSGRSARSAALLVGGTPSSATKVKSSVLKRRIRFASAASGRSAARFSGQSRRSCRLKLGVASRADAVIWAYQHGFARR
jgi:hypothetical protein